MMTGTRPAEERVTNAATSKTANFQMALPTLWNGKFMFKGCMVLCGVVDVPELESVRHGYASATTDDGHIGEAELLDQRDVALGEQWNGVQPIGAGCAAKTGMRRDEDVRPMSRE